MSCDIIMVVWDNKELTRQCVNSIFANTHCAYRLVIVDNASDDPTKEYLESIEASYPDRVNLIRNEENVGFTKAVNQGVSRGLINQTPTDYACIINNDILVFDNWLSEMTAVAESSKAIGIVNPNNNFGRKKPWNESYEQYASRMTEGQQGKFVETASPVGFCYLIKREVINKIGLWDERFNPGYFEDTEYALRARNAGYKSVFAKGAFVFHLEHASFKKRGFNKLFKQSEEKFYSLYKRPQRMLYVLTRPAGRAFQDEARKFLDEGAWVSVYLKKSGPKIELPEHTYARAYYFSDLFFRTKVFLKVLFKKKKFTKIFVDDKKMEALWRTRKV